VVMLHYSRAKSQNSFIIFHELELWFMNFSLNLNLNSLLELYLDSDLKVLFWIKHAEVKLR
jgi:hypothetical protein